LLVIFSEQWILSTAVFVPCIVGFFRRIGMEYADEKTYEVAIKSVYTIFIYAIIAFVTEIRCKQSFLGKE
jgi:hypothetical protein